MPVPHSPRQPLSLGTMTRRLVTVGALSCAAVLASAASAAAEPSCAGTVFSGVAKSGSGAVAERVALIKNVFIPALEPEGTTFGHVISRRLAQAPCD